MKTSSQDVTSLLLVCGIAAGVASAVDAQDFLPYEGKNAVREGDGGTKKVVNGIDFWADGAPCARQRAMMLYTSESPTAWASRRLRRRQPP